MQAACPSAFLASYTHDSDTSRYGEKSIYSIYGKLLEIRYVNLMCMIKPGYYGDIIFVYLYTS